MLAFDLRGPPQERFFELEGATLRYYSRRALRGVVILTGCSMEHDDRELTIAVTKPGRSSPIVTVRCSAKADHTNWVAVLKSAATADAKSSARTKATRNKGACKTCSHRPSRPPSEGRC